MRHSIKLLALAAAACLALAAGSARATTVGLETQVGSSAGLDIQVDITVDGSYAYFTFTNESTGDSVNSTIGQIYFEEGLGTMLGAWTVTEGSVAFHSEPPDDVSPSDPPGIGDWSGTYVAFGADPPPTKNGIATGGDFLTVAFVYTGTLDDLLAAVVSGDGSFQIAAHVLTCPVSGSSCTVQTPSTVPLPAAAWLFGSALAGLVGIGRRRTLVARVTEAGSA